MKTELKPLILIIFLLSTLSGACASLLPEGDTEKAVYIDLRKIVETRQRTSEWLLDSKEIHEASPAAMRSVCETSPKDSVRLMRWLDAQIDAEGGSAEEAFKTADGDKGEIGEILTLERVRLVLGHVEGLRDECPFWLPLNPDFQGVQTDAGRFVVLLESNGGGSLIISGGKAGFGGEGGARLLGGWGVGHGLTLALGGELGGRGALGGGEDQALTAQFTAGVPVLVRLHNLSQVIDIEIAPTATSDPEDFDPRFGVRFTLAAGLSAVRISDFMPTIMGMINYELQPAMNGLPTTHIARIGTRFSINYDP